jgi:hypothetical protein
MSHPECKVRGSTNNETSGFGQDRVITLTYRPEVSYGFQVCHSAPRTPQTDQQQAQLLLHLCTFRAPLLQTLNRTLDVRLVRTFVHTIEAIITWRHRQHGLLLSELGGYLADPAHAPAGTKRLSNLLRSPNWQAQDSADWLWQRAVAQVQSLQAAGDDPLLIWDESVLEKPESQQSEGLCAVRSSKARRLKRIRPGFFHPPAGRPLCVAGLHWLGLLVTSRTQPPVVAAMQWWTTRGPRATFVLRWPKRYQLLDNWGDERKAWEIARGKRSQDYRLLRDSHTRQQRKVGWERREKLLLLATLAYAFLLSLLAATLEDLRDWLLRHWCHRTGKRSRDTPALLYRLRSALSRLWHAYPGSPTAPL